MTVPMTANTSRIKNTTTKVTTVAENVFMIGADQTVIALGNVVSP